MSFRPPVDAGRIREFLRRLGQRFRHPATLHLVGGTTLVLDGYRASTLDIDITYQVAPEHHAALVEAIRAIQRQLAINVEEASPGDFIPLPRGWEDRHEFLGRFGHIEVFHFDPYSTALSKIARGHEEDFHDVMALLRHERIEMDRLERAFREIEPRLPEWGLRLDPAEFAAKFARLQIEWREGRDGD